MSQRRGFRESDQDCVAAIAFFSLVAEAAFALHGYSIAGETNQGNDYTGVFVERRDVAIVGQSATGCASPYTGEQVYQAQ